ncbi:MAG: squalene/phytoene synthase family protein [Syntrophales bacterium]|jgi:farnesyl-diphosphate farnesyltransferase|nr:squalene/phytoene synthase family protein [Syntrophales bacterium]MCK9528707.1 squalene/phytoene synthase family protein [Syntrophales bacterium]MDX9922660.1 squalene/phytoene synthase family protein [Syntrophales bacterium]
MTREDSDFRVCEGHLDRVSRTFALNIRVLRGDVYRAMLLAYLLCRIADTIEDEPSLPPEAKVAGLTAFADLFPPEPGRPVPIEEFIHSLNVPGTGPDTDLLRDSPRVFREFLKLPSRARTTISERVREMSLGMASFQRGRSGGLVTLADREELERYCYYVAGTVGLLITDLFFRDGEGWILPDSTRDALVSRSVGFGLGLQMTNIAKDYMGDLGRGWCYVPRSYFDDEGIDPAGDLLESNGRAYGRVLGRLLDDALAHLDEAVIYVLHIPRRFIRYRLFCLWPLFMALETLALVSRSEARLFRGEAVKITRQDVKKILVRSSFAVLSNGTIRSLYDGARRRAAREN